MTEQVEVELVIAAYKPRYVKIEGVWYIRRDHYAEQLKAAIESAFMDGMRFAQIPVKPKVRRGPNVMRKVVGEIVPQ